MKSGARRPDILIGGVGDMQLYPKNENIPDFSDLATLLVLNVSKSLNLVTNPNILAFVNT